MPQPHPERHIGTDWVSSLERVFETQPYKDIDPNNPGLARLFPPDATIVGAQARFKEALDLLTGFTWKIGDFQASTPTEKDQRLVLVERLSGDELERQYMLFPALQEMLVNEHQPPQFPVDPLQDMIGGLRVLGQ